MAFEIIWTRNATIQFDEIIDFLLITWNENIVISFLKLVESELEFIKRNPNTYPLFDTNKNIRKVVIHKNVSLFYKIQNNQIVLISFWDNRQNPINLTL